MFNKRPLDIVEAVWEGGTFLALEIAGFNIYQGAGPGQPIPAGVKPIGYLPAYPNGIIADGFGVGGFGHGGFGLSATTYTWTSAELFPAGLWYFAVSVVDIANEEGARYNFSASVVNRPPPPAKGPDGLRVRYTYDPTTKIITITWLAAPPSP
jgi:hypothetical protein